MEVGHTASSGSLTRRYRKVLVIILVLAVTFTVANAYFSAAKPLSREQIALNKAVAYFARFFNATVGLIRESPGGQEYWLYSDNYLASLALARYDPTNRNAVSFGRSLYYVVQSYASTLSASLRLNQYTALNSTKSSFLCSREYALTWSGQGNASLSYNTRAIIKTTANDGDPACASIQENYADLLFLQALMAHRVGDNASALSFYHAAANDFDGTGIKDTPFTVMNSGEFNTYQTYKVAL